MLAISTSAASLFDDAKERGINETCNSYLNQIEKSYNLNGLNITFAHPINPSKFPSLHISTQKYNNGASTFSATLTPDQDYCYVSTVFVTSITNQSCSEITSIRIENNPDMIVSDYSDGAYTILSPSDDSYQIILTTTGETSCSLTESRMIWPGK
tara:strand:+ start:186 stop:650 length:465 start_codon:yes stop_codon:yes gene_type:complete